MEHGREVQEYATPACGSCPIKLPCTRNKDGRRITRWVDEDLLDAMAERVRTHPDIMRQRKAMVEQPFGTIKRAMDQGYFLRKGLPKAGAEMSLTVLAYNIRRVITILGVPAMIAALVAGRSGVVSVTPVIILLVASMIMIILVVGRHHQPGVFTRSAGKDDWDPGRTPGALDVAHIRQVNVQHLPVQE